MRELAQTLGVFRDDVLSDFLVVFDRLSFSEVEERGVGDQSDASEAVFEDVVGVEHPDLPDAVEVWVCFDAFEQLDDVVVAGLDVQFLTGERVEVDIGVELGFGAFPAVGERQDRVEASEPDVLDLALDDVQGLQAVADFLHGDGLHGLHFLESRAQLLEVVAEARFVELDERVLEVLDVFDDVLLDAGLYLRGDLVQRHAGERVAFEIADHWVSRGYLGPCGGRSTRARLSCRSP